MMQRATGRAVAGYKKTLAALAAFVAVVAEPAVGISRQKAGDSAAMPGLLLPPWPPTWNLSQSTVRTSTLCSPLLAAADGTKYTPSSHTRR